MASIGGQFGLTRRQVLDILRDAEAPELYRSRQDQRQLMQEEVRRLTGEVADLRRQLEVRETEIAKLRQEMADLLRQQADVIEPDSDTE
jgi:septal ring factor EnvC (AmiA/AmiB activator)